MKKLLTILVLIMLIISFFQITSMYALYKEQLQSEYSTLLGVWAIKVNGTDISSGEQNIEFEIADSQLQYIDSEYIQAGKIAPGGQAYFDIQIDPTNTDVSVIYTIVVGSDTARSAGIELLRAESYFQKDGETDQITNDTVVQEEGNIYKGVIPIDKITAGYKNYVRLYIEWTNNEANNETDSTLGETADSVISVPVGVNIKQYTGEVIGNGS